MFPRTWSEELVSEWLQLKGYVVESGIPIMAMKKGGRAEADILGYGIEKEGLDIVHIEVGRLGNSNQTIEKFKDKFSDKRKDAVKKYIRSKLNIPVRNYRTIYLSLYKKPRYERALEASTNCEEWKCMVDFIFDDVIPTIDEWRKNPHYEMRSSQEASLPDGLWLLKLLDHITRFGKDRFFIEPKHETRRLSL